MVIGPGGVSLTVRTWALARQGFVTPVDVCLGLGWLHSSNVDDWRRGRVDDLEYFLPVHDDRIAELTVCLDGWAGERGLERTEAEYVSATRNRRPLRFFAGGPAVLCLACADMDHLVFLPSGEAALTRRAKKASGLSAVVVRWSRTRKRYKRQGLRNDLDRHADQPPSRSCSRSSRSCSSYRGCGDGSSE